MRKPWTRREKRNWPSVLEMPKKCFPPSGQTQRPIAESPQSFCSNTIEVEVDSARQAATSEFETPPQRTATTQTSSFLSKMASAALPMWKALPKHLIPETRRETIDMLENKLDLCSTATPEDDLTANDYIKSLTSVSAEPLLSFLKNEIEAVLFLYATVNPITARVNTAIIQRFDKPTHEYASQVLNPTFLPKETMLQFLYRIQNPGKRATFPTDPQLNMMLLRTLKHIPELGHVPFQNPAPTYQQIIDGSIWNNMEQIIDGSINILIVIETTAALPITISSNPRRTTTSKLCEYCQKPGHEARNCWMKYPEKRPTTAGMMHLLSFMSEDQSDMIREWRGHSSG